MRPLPQPSSSSRSPIDSPGPSAEPEPARRHLSKLQRALKRCGRAVQEVDRFVRLHFWGFTFFLALLGLVSVDGNPAPGILLSVMAVGLLFHNFAYVLNDVVDLKVDRTQEARRLDPLVRGAITPRQALAFALLQAPLAFAVSAAAGAPLAANLCLAIGFVLMTVYNVWGKACFCPPLTDLAQGLAWACLVLYGALAGAGTVAPLTWIVAGSATGFILLINGIHGGLRDLDNDLRQGRRTTAIFFGSRPRPEGASISSALKVFALTVQLMLVALAVAPFVVPGLFYSQAPSTGWIVFQGVLQAINIWFLWRVFQTGSPTWGRDFRIHIFLLLIGPVVLCGPRMEGLVAWIFPWVFFGPFLLVEVSGEIALGVRDRFRAGIRQLLIKTPPADDAEPVSPH